MTKLQYDIVDINQASLEDLMKISGIGLTLGQGIIAHRPYDEIDDLVRVPGINAAKLTTLKPFITLGKKQPIPTSPKSSTTAEEISGAPVTKLGNTEAFVFLEDRNERQDALLIIFGGFILGLIILTLRRSSR